MGFDHTAIPLLKNGMQNSRLGWNKSSNHHIEIQSNLQKYCRALDWTRADSFGFEAPETWRGFVEKNRPKKLT
jgi:hypothetical protein